MAIYMPYIDQILGKQWVQAMMATGHKRMAWTWLSPTGDPADPPEHPAGGHPGLGNGRCGACEAARLK